VVYESRLSRAGVAGLRLPLPEGLADDESVEIWWTLCITAPIAPKDPAEYTMAGCEVLLRPHQYRYAFNDPNTKKKVGEADIRTEKDLARRYIRQGLERSKMPMSKSAPKMAGREQGRREAGKWETVIQQRFSKLSASTLVEPTVELNHIARDSGTLRSDVDDLPYALIVTVRTKSMIDLYSMVTEQFPLLAPIQAQVQLRI
jgi:hypothetical protein